MGVSPYIHGDRHGVYGEEYLMILIVSFLLLYPVQKTMLMSADIVAVFVAVFVAVVGVCLVAILSIHRNSLFNLVDA